MQIKNGKLLLVFVCVRGVVHGITDNRGIGNFRRHVKIQQFVVRRRCWLFLWIHWQNISDVSLRGRLCGDFGCPHENSCYQNPSMNTVFQCWVLVHQHWLLGSGWVYFHLWLSISKSWPTKSNFILISVPAYLYFSVISMWNTFPLSPFSLVQTNTMNTKLLYSCT